MPLSWLALRCLRPRARTARRAGRRRESRARFSHRAHPCREAGGVIFTYMGPDQPPVLPDYEFLTSRKSSDGDQAFCINAIIYRETKATSIRFIYRSCTNFSPKTKLPLQRVVSPAPDATDNTLLGKDIAPTIEVELTDYGLRIFSLRATAGGQDAICGLPTSSCRTSLPLAVPRSAKAIPFTGTCRSMTRRIGNMCSCSAGKKRWHRNCSTRAELSWTRISV